MISVVRETDRPEMTVAVYRGLNITIQQLLMQMTQETDWRELVDRKIVEAPSNFIAGRPEDAFHFSWCFSDLRCGVWLLTVILDIYIYIYIV